MTGGKDPGIGEGKWEIYNELLKEGRLTVRMFVLWAGPRRLDDAAWMHQDWNKNLDEVERQVTVSAEVVRHTSGSPEQTPFDPLDERHHGGVGQCVMRRPVAQRGKRVRQLVVREELPQEAGGHADRERGVVRYRCDSRRKAHRDRLGREVVGCGHDCIQRREHRRQHSQDRPARAAVVAGTFTDDAAEDEGTITRVEDDRMIRRDEGMKPVLPHLPVEPLPPAPSLVEELLEAGQQSGVEVGAGGR